MMPLSRGRIYHSLKDEVGDLFKASTQQLTSDKNVEVFVSEFKTYMGREFCLPFPFARSALYFVLKSLNLEKGSEVLMPPITIKPMVDVVLQLGLVPVYVDLEDQSYCFNIDILKKSIGKNTKVALVTYLFGVVPEIEKIISVLKASDIFIVEDFSQALNAEYKGKKLGTFGDCSIYSASSMKTLDTYGGGLFFTDDEELYGKLAKQIESKFCETARAVLVKKIFTNIFRTFFSNRLVFAGFTFYALKVVRALSPRYYKILTGARLGLEPCLELLPEWLQKYTDIQAARGREKLNTIAAEDEIRRKNVQVFIESLDLVLHERIPVEHPGAKNIYWQLPFFVDDFSEFSSFLLKNGIDTGTTNLSLCSELDIYPEYVTSTPVANRIKHSAAFIAVYPGLKINTIKSIACILNNYYASREN